MSIGISKEVAKLVFKMALPYFLMIGIVITIFKFINVNVFSFPCVLTVVSGLFLIFGNNKLTFWSFVKHLVKTYFFSTLIYLIITFLGGYGMIGFSLIIIVFVGIRIYKGRKLYNETTRWGADLLRGKKTNLNFEEALKKDEKNK